MAANLLTIPLEILYIIIDDGELSSADVKCLRVVHSGLSRLLSPRLFHTIGYWFRDNKYGEATLQNPSWGVQRSPRKIRKGITQQMMDVERLRGSEMAQIPHIFRLVVNSTQKVGDFPGFVDAFLTDYTKLDRMFTNVSAVDVIFHLEVMKIEQERTLMGVIGEYSRGKSLRVKLTGITCFRLPSLAMVPAHVETLHLCVGSVKKTTPKAVKDLLCRCTTLKHLHLSDFRGSAGKVFEEVPSEVLGNIESLGAVFDSRWDESGFCGIPGRGLLTPSNLAKMVSLRNLDIDDSELGIDRDGRTLWEDLKHSNIRLETLKPSNLSDSLVEYLSSAESTSRLKELRLKLRPASYSVRLNDHASATRTEHRSVIFFRQALNNLQRTVTHLEFTVQSPSYFFNWPWNEYLPICQHFSFLDRGLKYTFDRLETLSTTIFWAAGNFNSFMRAIQKSPNLRQIDLGIYARAIDLEASRSPGPKNIHFSVISLEVETYLAPQESVWTQGLVMSIEAVSMDTARSIFQFRLGYPRWNKRYEYKKNRWA